MPCAVVTLCCRIFVVCWIFVVADVGEVINYEDIVELQGVNLAKHLRDTFGYDLYAYSRDVAALFGFGVFLRLVAMVLMIVLDRKKKM